MRRFASSLILAVISAVSGTQVILQVERPLSNSECGNVTAQFLVNSSWGGMHVLAEEDWQSSQALTKHFDEEAWPTRVRLSANSLRSCDLKRVLLIDSAGHEYVIRNSSVSSEVADTQLSADAAFVYYDLIVPPSRFTLQIDTSSRPYAGSPGASAQFLVNGKWSQPQRLHNGKWMGSGDTIRKEFEMQAWPTYVRLITHSKDAWGYRRIKLIDAVGREYIALDSENGAPYGNNDFWLDGDEIAVTQREYAVPVEPYGEDVVLQVEVSGRQETDHNEAHVQFLVNNLWTEPQMMKLYSGGIDERAGWFLRQREHTAVILKVASKIRAWPSMIRLTTNSTDNVTHMKVILRDAVGHEYVVHDSKTDIGAVASEDTPLVLQRDFVIPRSRFTVQVDVSAQKYAGGSSASVQFLVNGRWTDPQILRQGDWYGSAVLTKQFEMHAWPTKVRLINDSTDAFGYRRIILIDDDGNEYIVLDSDNGAPYGKNDFWLDGDQIAIAERDFVVPPSPFAVEFALLVEASMRPRGSSVSSQFFVNGRWTEPQILWPDVARPTGNGFLRPDQRGSQTFTARSMTRAWPSMVRLTTNSADTVTPRHIVLTENAGQEHVLLNSENNTSDVTYDFGLNRDAHSASHRDFDIPVSRFTLQVETSTQKHAGGSRANVQFLVCGHWTSAEILRQGAWHPGEALTKEFSTKAWPTKVRLINDSPDAWGYKKIFLIDRSGDEHVILDSANGAQYGNNDFWLDGNQIAVTERDYNIFARKDEL